MMDKRNRKLYRTVAIGGNIWMAENLNYEVENSYCYNNSADSCAKYGRLYTWAAAIDSVKLATDAGNPQDCGYRKTCTLPAKVQGICPTGWHLPSKSESEALFTAVGGKSTAGNILKSQTGWFLGGKGTDAFGFAVLPAGDRSRSGDFSSDGADAYFWCSAEATVYLAYHMYFRYCDEDASVSNNSKGNAYSVRCVKDEE